MNTLRSSLIVVVTAVLAGPACGQTPRPRFTGERVYVVGTRDRYQSVRNEIHKIEQTSKQTYYVVVIKTSGRGSNPTIRYTDRLYGQWKRTATSTKLKLDPKRHVLIVLAEKNRQISLHVGTELQSKYGLRRSSINRRLVNPYFLPQARAKRLAEGLRRLVRGTEKLIRQQDARRRSRAAQRKKRIAEVRRNAQAALDSGKRLLKDIELQVVQTKKAGLPVKRVVDALPIERKKLAAAEKLFQSKPRETVRQASSIVNRLTAHLQETRQLPLIQESVTAELATIESAAQQLGKRIDEQDDEVPVLALELKLDGVQQDLDKIRNTNSTDPRSAQSKLKKLNRDLTLVRNGLGELPQLIATAKGLEENIVNQRELLTSQIKRAKDQGVNVAMADEALLAIDKNVKRAISQKRQNLRQAISTLRTTQARFFTTSESLQAAISRRHFLTVILPTIVGTVVVLIVIIVFVVLRSRYKARYAAASDGCTALKKRSVDVLDTIEAFKKRHAELPFAIDRYKEPMFGKTRFEYNAFNDKLSDFRNAWLALMEDAEKVEELIKSARFPSTSKLQEAKEALDKVSFDEVESWQNACEQHLGELEQAPAAVALSTVELESSLQSLRDHFDQIRNRDLETDAFDSTYERWLADQKELTQAKTGDPLGVRQACEELCSSIGELTKRCDTVLTLAQQADELSTDLSNAESSAASHRQDGLRLSDEVCNPDPHIRDGRYHHAAMRRSLNEGDVELAGEQFAKATASAASASSVMAQQVAARDRCQAEFPTSRTESADLANKLARCRRQVEQLQGEFAEESWQGVRLAPTHTADMLSRIAERDEQARQLMEAEIQRYIQAEGLLVEINKLQAKSRQEMSEVEQHLAHLIELRQGCQERVSQIDEKVDSLTTWFDKHQSVVGVVAHEHFDAATDAHKVSEEDFAKERPHWPRIWHEQTDAIELLGLARQHAETDIHWHGQYTDQVKSIKAQMGEVKRLLDNNTADRPRSNKLFHDAETKLNSTSADRSVDPVPDWKSLCQLLDGIGETFDKSKSLAQEDIRLAKQASAEIRDANRALSRASSFLQEGVSADVRSADRSLNEARRHFLAQDYEAAVRDADNAEEEARQALSQAEESARTIKRRREQAEWQDRRRRRRNGHTYEVGNSSGVSFIGSVNPSNTSSQSW